MTETFSDRAHLCQQISFIPKCVTEGVYPGVPQVIGSRGLFIPLFLDLLSGKMTSPLSSKMLRLRSVTCPAYWPMEGKGRWMDNLSGQDVFIERLKYNQQCK